MDGSASQARKTRRGSRTGGGVEEIQGTAGRVTVISVLFRVIV